MSDAASDRFLDAMVSGAHDVQADMSDKFEQRCVQHVLTQLGLGAQIKYLQAKRKRETDVEGLDFMWFSGMFPDCPLQFSTSCLSHQIARRNWPRDWFLSFDKLPIVKAYEGYRQAMLENGVAGPIGMIFTWPGWQKHLLFHDWKHSRIRDQGYWGYRASANYDVWLEPLDQVLAEVLRRWTPEIL